MIRFYTSKIPLVKLLVQPLSIKIPTTFFYHLPFFPMRRCLPKILGIAIKQAPDFFQKFRRRVMANSNRLSSSFRQLSSKVVDRVLNSSLESSGN